MGTFTRALACLAALVSITGCGAGGDGQGTGGSSSSSTSSSASGDPFVPPSFVGIHISSAVVRPWDSNKQQWDGGAATPEDIAKLAALLGEASPYAGVAAWVA